MLLCVGIFCGACGAREVDHPEWRKYFEQAGVDGCLLVYDQNADQSHVYNAARCRTGFLPASTYKIFNSLVALETRVATNADFSLAWDGQVRSIPEWNRDHVLKTAIKYSVVWYYQELARRVGLERMRKYLELAEYGNGDLSAGIDQFWLRGGFRVTPEEQIRLLRRLRADELPFSIRSQEIVQTILIEEQTPRYTLRAKTGLISEAGHELGWWVGYVEQSGDVLYFALNIQPAGIAPSDFAASRKPIVRAILTDYFSAL